MSAAPRLADPDADVRELLRELVAEVRGLRADLAERGREPARSLRHEDRAAMRRILPVLAAHFQGTFAAWELVDFAEQRDALGANLRIVLGARTAQQIGKLFARAQGQEIDGLTLRRVKSDANGAVWECIGNGSS